MFQKGNRNLRLESNVELLDSSFKQDLFLQTGPSSICPSIYSTIHQPSFCAPIHLLPTLSLLVFIITYSTSFYIYLFSYINLASIQDSLTYLSIYLSILPIYPSVHYIPAYPSIYMFIYLFSTHIYSIHLLPFHFSSFPPFPSFLFLFFKYLSAWLLTLTHYLPPSARCQVR